MRFLFLPLIALPLMTTACAEDFALKPGYFATGYKYHHEEYKAPPGPDAPDLGYDYNRIDNASVMGTWMEITDALVDGLEKNQNMGAQDVYVEKLRHSNAFNEAYDFSLRQSLRDRGYMLLSQPSSDVLHVRYEGFRTQDADARKKLSYNDDPYEFLKPYYPEEPADFTFILTAAKDQQVLAQSYVERTVPTYGYLADEGQHEPEERIRAGQQAPQKRIVDHHNP